MKTHPVRLQPKSAFTLIELITVISIIAILMALLFPAIAGAKESARRAKAQTVVKDIVNACKNYSNDYGKYPPIEEAKEETGGGADGSKKDEPVSSFYAYGPKTGADGKAGDKVFKVNNDELFNVLRAIATGVNTDHKYNKRQTKYFEQPKAGDSKNPREGFCDGKEFDTKVTGQLMDPWGTQYAIVLDGDGDEQLDLKTFYTDLSDSKDVVRMSAVAFSLGKDGKRGDKGYEGKTRKENSKQSPDDLFSWQ